MGKNFESIEEPRDIRTEPFTFEELGIKQMSRIAEFGQRAMSSMGINQRYNLMGLEASIVAFAAIIPNEAVKKSIAEYKRKLNRDWLEEPDLRIKYFAVLMQWFDFLVNEFYKVGNVIPAKSVGVDFPDVPGEGDKNEH